MSKNIYLKSLTIIYLIGLSYLIAGPGHGGTDPLKNISNPKVAQVSGNLIKSKKDQIHKGQKLKRQNIQNIIKGTNLKCTIISLGGGVAGNYIVKV
ncbi:MAG: hypothetical protein KA116_08275 [Proteobacteria bacterium]|nr:hypothetical protein [Pseudomonadota bacterium]